MSSDGMEGRKWCRICHEQDLESCKDLESPCHCSGTLKFAHRDCIQRWCDQKGNTTCEICLQVFPLIAVALCYVLCSLCIYKLREAKGRRSPMLLSKFHKFEPEYTCTVKKKLQLIHTSETLSLVVTRNEPPEMEENVEGEEEEESRCVENRKLLAILFTTTLVLLIKNMYDLLSGGTPKAYPFSLLTVVVVKATGIIVPMYILIRITAMISNSIYHHQHHPIPTRHL